MKRTSTRAAMLHKFEFDAKDIQEFYIESEKLDYMEGRARRHLEKAGLPHEGGEVSYWLSYDERPSTLTLAIYLTV